jgi:hypothetical protein
MSELRQRPGKGEEKAADKEADAERRVEYIKVASESAPEAVRPYIVKAAPVVVAIWVKSVFTTRSSSPHQQCFPHISFKPLLLLLLLFVCILFFIFFIFSYRVLVNP